MDGILAGLFDFDGNGELSAFEQAAELMFLDEAESEEKRKSLFARDDEESDSDW